MDKVRMAPAIWSRGHYGPVQYGKTNTFANSSSNCPPAMIGTVPMYDAIGYLEKDFCWISPRRTFSRLSGPTRKKGWIS